MRNWSADHQRELVVLYIEEIEDRLSAGRLRERIARKFYNHENDVKLAMAMRRWAYGNAG